jgi:hypothetical protein
MTFAANRPLPTRRFRNRPETAKAVPNQPDETIWTMSRKRSKIIFAWTSD